MIKVGTLLRYQLLCKCTLWLVKCHGLHVVPCDLDDDGKLVEVDALSNVIPAATQGCISFTCQRFCTGWGFLWDPCRCHQRSGQSLGVLFLPLGAALWSVDNCPFDGGACDLNGDANKYIVKDGTLLDIFGFLKVLHVMFWLFEGFTLDVSLWQRCSKVQSVIK